MTPTQPCPYNDKDLISIFEYSKQLIHKCLRDFAPHADERKGKGGLGQLLEELFFHYDVNSRQEADFAFVHAELKCTPLKKNRSTDDLQIKERLVCSMINYCQDCDRPFEQSHFYRKCLVMLLMFYLHEPNVSKLDLHFVFSVLWRIPEKDLLIIRQDYELIVGKIRKGLAHTLSEGDTMYLGACRKGQKGDSLMEQPFSDIGAPRRAWSLKPAYMRIVLDETKRKNKGGAYCNYNVSDNTGNALFDLEQLRNNSVDEIIKERFAPYIGKSYEQLCHMLNLDVSAAKSKYAIVANRIAGNGTVSNVNRTEEFLKSGLTMKTIRVSHDGTIKESMSFENIDYNEVYNCKVWEDSRLYELFTSRFLFVVFRETSDIIKLPNGKTEKQYVLEKVGFWTMPQKTLKKVKQYWNNIRLNVRHNRISPEYFWSLADNKDFHVRPKASKATDLTDNPNGGKAKKYCYWFNAKYIKKIIDNEL